MAKKTSTMAKKSKLYWGRDTHVMPELQHWVRKLAGFLLDCIEERLRMLELDGTPVHIPDDLPQDAIDDLRGCGDMFVLELLNLRAKLLVDSGVLPPWLEQKERDRLVRFKECADPEVPF
jgi:hypothetical protein